MKFFKLITLIFVFGITGPVFSQNIKKNRDQICSYVSVLGNWAQGVINTFEGIVRFGSGTNYSKNEMLAIKDQWIKTYRKRDLITKNNLEICNIRGNPFRRWEKKHLLDINKNVGRVNNMAGELEAFLNKNQRLKNIPSFKDFLGAWKKLRKSDNYFK